VRGVLEGDGRILMDKEYKRLFKTLGILSTIGLTMAFSIGIGAGIGYLIDKKFNTSPYGLLIFLALGVVAAFKNLYSMYKKIEREKIF